MLLSASFSSKLAFQTQSWTGLACNSTLRKHRFLPNTWSRSLSNDVKVLHSGLCICSLTHQIQVKHKVFSVPLKSRRAYLSRGGYLAQPPNPSVWQQYGPKIVVWGFVGLCAAGYSYHLYSLAQFSKNGDRRHVDLIEQNFVNSRENLQHGRWWTLITSSFMHFELWHIGINMLGLVSLGPGAVRLFGSRGFLGLWFISALGCGATAIGWEYFQEQERRKRRQDRMTIPGYQLVKDDPTTSTTFARSIGASGSLLGVITALGCFNPRATVTVFPVPIPMSIGLVGLLFTTFSLGAMVTGIIPGIGHSGHLGGMALGAAYYYVLLRRRLRFRPL